MLAARPVLIMSAAMPTIGTVLIVRCAALMPACRALCRARVADKLQRRRGTRIGEHLKLVLSIIDREVQ
jgi:hypothetical protein